MCRSRLHTVLVAVIVAVPLIAAEPPASIPGPPTLVRQLLKESLDTNRDAPVRELECRDELRVGCLLHALGQYDRAAAAYRRARTLSESLIDSFPKTKRYRLYLATACNNSGALNRAIGRLPESEAQYSRAATLLGELRDCPPFVIHRRLHADVRSNLGLLYDAQGMFAEAREQYDQAGQIREALTRSLGQTYSIVGQLGIAAANGGPGPIAAHQFALHDLLRHLTGSDRETVMARMLTGLPVPREEAYSIHDSLIILNGPDGMSAVAERIGPRLWRNRFFGNALEAEIAKAAELGISPIRITSPASVADIGKDGAVFKWVVTEQGELFGLKRLEGDVIKHAIVSRGRPVLAAGNARVQGNKALLDRRSGHYRPDRDSMIVAKQKFEAAGFVVEVVEGGVE